MFEGLQQAGFFLVWGLGFGFFLGWFLRSCC